MDIKFAYIFGAFLALSLAGCAKNADEVFENHVYFDRTSEQTVTELSISIHDSFNETISAIIPRQAVNDITVKVGVDATRVEEFNTRYGENAVILPEGCYSFDRTEMKITAGNVTSPQMHVIFNNILKLDDKTTYVLPVVISEASVPIIDTRSVKYYLFKSSGIINIVPNLDGRMQTGGICLEDGNFIEFPWKKPEVVENLTAFTYEAYAYAEFSTDGLPTQSIKKSDNYRTPDNMYSLMGTESGILVRRWGNLDNSKWKADPSLGQVDSITYALEVKNLKNPSDTREGIRLPDFPDRKWTAFTLTYEQSDGLVKLYYDQKLVYTEDIGKKCPITIYPASSSESSFFVGHSNKCKIRWWPGCVTEVRIWNRALTAEEIAQPFHPYWLDLDNGEEVNGLVSYWKLDEGTGTSFKDYSGNGNNGTADRVVNWQKVKLPEQRIIL